jgi:hypothetical protein
MTYKNGLKWGLLLGVLAAVTAFGINVYATQEGRRNASILLALSAR